MTYLVQFFRDLNKLIEAVVAPMRNHEALAASSLHWLDSRIDDLSCSLTFYREADDKASRALGELTAQERRLKEMAKERVVAGERRRALSLLLKARQVSESMVKISGQKEASLAAQELLQDSLLTLRRIRKDFADKKIETSVAAAEKLDWGDSFTFNTQVNDIARATSVPDLHSMCALVQANDDFELSDTERRELEEELDRLLLSSSKV